MVRSSPSTCRLAFLKQADARATARPTPNWAKGNQACLPYLRVRRSYARISARRALSIGQTRILQRRFPSSASISFQKFARLTRSWTLSGKTASAKSHPELAFWAMNGGNPLPLPKKIKGKVSVPGIELRRELLTRAGFPMHRLPPVHYRRIDVGADDLIDACACAWVARRILEKKHFCFPANPPMDAKGLRMEINA